jgi:hypothetical protein
MNATLTDPRLPGGVASGKVISYSLTCKDGKFRGHVEIGVSIGYSAYLQEEIGTPEYTGASGYCQPGYQRYDGVLYVVGGTDGISDVSYIPPIAPPLVPLPMWTGSLSGNTSKQAGAISAGFQVNQLLAWEALMETALYTITGLGPNGTATLGPTSGYNGANGQQILVQRAWDLVMNTVSLGTVAYEMATNPVGYSFIATSVEQAPFNNGYSIACSLLECPLGINLEAPSNGN